MAEASTSSRAAGSALEALIDRGAGGIGSQQSVATSDRVKTLLTNFTANFSGVKQDPSDKTLPIKYYRDVNGVKDLAYTSAANRLLADAGINASYTLGEKDKDRVKEIAEARLAADFDSFFLNKFQHTKDPGKKALMEKIYPELIKKKEEQLLTDIELEVRLKMLDEFGPQTLEDYVVEYLKDKNMIDKAGDTESC